MPAVCLPSTGAGEQAGVPDGHTAAAAHPDEAVRGAGGPEAGGAGRPGAAVRPDQVQPRAWL